MRVLLVFYCGTWLLGGLALYFLLLSLGGDPGPATIPFLGGTAAIGAIVAVLAVFAPGGLGVRIDSAVYQGYVIPPYYDSLVGKLIVHGKTRGECLMRLRRALDEMVVEGIETTLPLFRAQVREPGIIDGDYHIHWLEQYLAGKAAS